MTGGRLSVYLILVVVVGCVVMLGELSSVSKRAAAQSAHTWPSPKSKWVGFPGSRGRLLPPGVLLTSSAAWSCAICSASSSSSSAWIYFAGQGTAFFGFLLYDYGGMLFFHVLFVIINILIVMGGVESA